MQLEMNFYNTIHLSGNELYEAHIQADKQAGRILLIMNKENKEMTPFEVHSIYNRIYPNTPITSIRRAITNLTDEGLLVKMMEQRDGGYGKPNYTWKLNIK